MMAIDIATHLGVWLLPWTDAVNKEDIMFRMGPVSRCVHYCLVAYPVPVRNCKLKQKSFLTWGGDGYKYSDNDGRTVSSQMLVG
jgi:hypothetical protein